MNYNERCFLDTAKMTAASPPMIAKINVADTLIADDPLPVFGSPGVVTGADGVVPREASHVGEVNVSLSVVTVPPNASA
jgi:hypothetical protein